GRDVLAPCGEGRAHDRLRCLGREAARPRVGRDDAAEIELAAAVDLLPLQARKRDGTAALPLDRRPEAHPSVALEAVDLLPDPLLGLPEICGVLELERTDHEPLRLDREVDPHFFSQTETCFVLSAVKGERSQSAQRSRSAMPASRAIRSSSAGETERNGTERRRHSPSTSEKWCETSLCVSKSSSSTPTWVSLRSKTSSRCVFGTPTSTTKHPPGPRCAAAFANASTWPSWLVTLLIELKTV